MRRPRRGTKAQQAANKRWGRRESVTNPELLESACPTCGAAPGDRCTFEFQGDVVRMAYVHVPRLVVAE